MQSWAKKCIFRATIMKKRVFTYFLLTVMVCAVALPTYIVLSQENCENTHIVEDYDRDTDENVGEFELNFYFEDALTISHPVSQRRKETTYLSKTYATVNRRLENPPPETVPSYLL
ncbi:hypothetical protein TPENAI_10343 [Tenacibaculum litopenaei]